MRDVGFAIGAVLLGAAASGCSSCADDSPPPDWVAVVASFSGPVTVRLTPREADQSAAAGQHLRVGARLQTGAAAEAQLELRNGGRLTVKPGSVVSFRSTAPAQQLSLELLRGTVVGKASTVKANELVIGVGKRRVHLASRSRATVAAPGAGEPRIAVELGQAVVTGPSGERRTIFAGKPMTLYTKPRKPDAGVAEPDAAVAPELVYYLKSTGRGRVMVKGPEARRFGKAPPRRTIEIKPGSTVRLLRRARATIGHQHGGGAQVSGPARLVVVAPEGATAETPPLLRLEGRGALKLRRQGKQGRGGATIEVEGVRLTARIRHRRVDVQVRRERGQAVIAVSAGAATLAGRRRTVQVEARQRATVSRGRITGPLTPPAAPLQLRSPSRQRVFTPEARLPVTLRWRLPEGARDALVRVSRSGDLARPLFNDRIRRRHVTIARVARGSLFWRVQPTDGEGSPVGKAMRGRLQLFRDTSHRLLKHRRRIHNTIHLRSRSTVVYFQNLVPRFTFRWDPIPGAASYQLKIMRETNLAKPLVSRRLFRTSVDVTRGRLGEGSYIWYVAGRGADGKLIRATSGRRLTISYDNATPDLQIKSPRHNTAVSADSVEVIGVTTSGSQISINGTTVALDRTSRFRHPVALRPGQNLIVIRVTDRRRRQSLYLRRVIRR